MRKRFQQKLKYMQEDYKEEWTQKMQRLEKQDILHFNQMNNQVFKLEN